MKMRVGEEAVVTCAKGYAWWHSGDASSTPIPSSSSSSPSGDEELEMHITMESFTKDKNTWELEGSEKVTWAEATKAKGNTWFKKGDWRRAATKYRKAVDAVARSEDDELKKECQLVRHACQLNLAAALLKVVKDDPDVCTEVIKVTSSVLAESTANVKALFRRAQAYAAQGEFEMAEHDLGAAQNAEPDNKEVINERKRIKLAAKNQDQKQKAMFAKMFA